MVGHQLLVLLLLAPPDMTCFGDGLVALRYSPAAHHRAGSSAAYPVADAASTAGATTDGPPSRRLRSAVTRHAAPLLAAASTAAGDEPPKSALTRWFVANRSLILLVCLIVHKCSTDGLTRYTRVRGAYSGATVAVMSEVLKFPLIATAIASFGGGYRSVLPLFKQAFTRKPFANAWIALCYTFNNLLYFDALSALSAVAYQVLSQSKTLFTAGLMYFIVGKRLLRRQLAAIALLIGGALAVQFQELARAGAGAAGLGAAGATVQAIYWGAALTLFSSFISALPNVAYERVLKTEGENQWVNNVQVTVWIMLWIGAASYIGPVFGAIGSLANGGGAAALPSIPSIADLIATVTGAPAAIVSSFAGFTPAVWGVVVLKALNGLLIPATFKYADNILYAYAKPSSIVVTTILGCLLSRQWPSISLIFGVSAVVGSIFLYSSKPKPKTA